MTRLTLQASARAACLALLFALAGCGTDDVSAGGEGAGSGDATDTIDAGQTDTGAEPDAEGDTEEDVQTDAEDDATEDAIEDTVTDSGPQVDVGPPPTCADDSECDDGLTCTEDVCDPDTLSCVWTLRANRCLINGVCVGADDVSPRNPCRVCDPVSDAFAYTTAADGAACDDGDACTLGAACLAGVCQGEPLACDDGNPCTEDLCDSATGCLFPAGFEGESCDDGSACTEGDSCSAGACVGDTVSCDDDNACTADTCDDALGCSNEALSDVACEDGDACTVGDTCVEGVCEVGEARNCDDGNECTLDFCDEFAGCSYLPNLNPCCTGTVSICDDRDPCTTDICDPESGDCFYESNTAVCDDGDACTENDQCDEGACDGEDVDCAVDNPCLAPFCDSEEGCLTEALDGVACDDGVDCTVDDTCSMGVCVGVSECTCDPDFGLEALKVVSAEIGGTPTVRPEFCDRVTGCDAGVPNALNFVSGFANEPLAEAVVAGELSLVIDIDDLARTPFFMSLATGALSPDDAGCDFQTEICRYTVDASFYDPDSCEPVVELGLARSGDGIFLAGPPAVFPFDVPFGDTVLSLTLYNVEFFGELSFTGDDPTGLDGVIAGAVFKDDLSTALSALPADTLPLDIDQVIGLLDVLVTEDIDTDGDGTADAVSIALVIEAIGAEIVGVTP